MQISKLIRKSEDLPNDMIINHAGNFCSTRLEHPVHAFNPKFLLKEALGQKHMGCGDPALDNIID
jgi:hypothetical protein